MVWRKMNPAIYRLRSKTGGELLVIKSKFRENLEHFFGITITGELISISFLRTQR